MGNIVYQKKEIDQKKIIKMYWDLESSSVVISSQSFASTSVEIKINSDTVNLDFDNEGLGSITFEPSTPQSKYYVTLVEQNDVTGATEVSFCF